MKPKAYIKHLDYLIAENEFVFESDITDNSIFKDSMYEDKASFLKFAANQLGGMTSIRMEKNRTMEEMVEELLDKNLDDGNIIPEAIDHIIIATDFSDRLLDFGHYVQYEFEMPDADVTRISENYCANIDKALGLAATLVQTDADKEKNVLIICGTKYEPNTDERLIANYAVMGDGVGIILVSNNAEDAVLSFRNQQTITKGVLHARNVDEDNAILHFQSYTECLDKLFEDDAEITKDDIDGIVLHNSNLMLLEQVFGAYEIDITKIDKTNQGKYGHLGTADFVVNLKTHVENTKDSNRILLLNLGANGTYVGTILERV
ncbi:3-oxoacyl-[acyl-carrier-protein] synthase III C-terminal domain-containing protein [Kordia jejudonensis]|uniref:3-oxoacyl-[acyl-carrier-protein] synthase III C-terminal domain-containing protein n=1 Tax=Kordia jejudonensis TaxID=1348245 RepID=UPI000629463A|nr:3-oxoacyl-[acyl-carrier-protein] synthase III C-terminal domain-containing protein [Kordia jejudonensis]